jgi:exodeoxyribonuclease VII small subunit
MAPPRKAKTEATRAAEDELPFEAAMDRLEAVVKSLEAGEIELETALSRFEEGVVLVRSCSQQLEVAERRIETLVRESDGLVARPFEVGEVGEAENEVADAADDSEGEAL